VHSPFLGVGDCRRTPLERQAAQRAGRLTGIRDTLGVVEELRRKGCTLTGATGALSCRL
jgi:hypothetical protein